MHTKREPARKRSEDEASGGRQAATINIKQNVGKANIVIKNNNNRRPSGEYGRKEKERQ